MKKLALINLLIFITILFLATNSYAGENILINLQLSDQFDKPLATTVYFKNERTLKISSFSSDAQGIVQCNVANGDSYLITVRSCDDIYTYDLSNISDKELSLHLKFNTANNSKLATTFSALIAIKILNNSGVNKVSIKGTESFAGSEDAHNDSVIFKVPVANNYKIQIEHTTINNNNIAISNQAEKILYYALYYTDIHHAELIPVTEDSSILFIRQIDPDNKVVTGETVTITADKKRNKYSLTTGRDGTAYLVVAKGDVYTLSLKYFPSYIRINIPDEKNLFITGLARIWYPGSATIERLKKEEALRIRERDSLYLLYEKVRELAKTDFNRSIQLDANTANDALKNDPKHFEKLRNVVCGVLYRNKKNWTNKIIVTDVTGSMYPYMYQVALWHTLEFMNKQPSEYVFFNDGDATPDSKKVIGRTGGIYFSAEKIPEQVISTMYTAMQKGSGGDGPENDTEALLFAQDKMNKNAELILIADNYSPVKDKLLFDGLKVPVRVVICGGNFGVHPDYLELAYKTGGSIHTIEEDILDLASLHDEESFTIQGKTYIFVKGKFLPATKRL